MKRFFTLGFVILTISIIYEQTVFAGQMYGSDISWICIGKDSFLVKIAGYKVCNGLIMGSTPIYCYCNTTGSHISNVNTTMGSSTDITPTCKSSCTRCSNPSCSFPYGIQKYEFTTLVVLSYAGSCCEIRMSWGSSSWSSDITTGAAAQSFYTEALLNRCQNPCTSSPSFTNNPIIIACDSQPFTFQQGVIDTTTINGKLSDSLTYQWTQPLQDYITPTTWVDQYNYDNPLDYWGFPNQNLPFPRGFHLDPNTGDIQFQPMQEEITIMAVKVNQYRKGILIGQITRDFGVIMINCTNHPPTITTPGNTSYVQGCADSAISFNFSSNDQDAPDSVTLSWNNALPGATFTTTNGLAKHPTATLTWVPNNQQISMNPYPFSVTAKDNACPINGYITKSYQIYVLSIKPVAAFSSNSNSQCINGNNYIFTNNSNSCNGKFTSLWDFGDHTTSTAISPSHTYSNTGTYTVKLVVNAGLKDSSIRNVYVYQSAAFTTNNSSQCIVGNNFIFTNNSCIINGILFSSFWDFGDHTTSTALSPAHTYTNAGTYSVKLVVTSNSGFKDSVINNIYVYQKTSFTSNAKTECIKGNSFIFTNTSCMNQNKFSSLWNFGDQTTSTTLSPSHTYKSVGSYNVKLITITDSGYKDSFTYGISIYPDAITDFTVSDTSECITSNVFVFSNNSSGANSYLWIFGKDSNIYLSTPIPKLYYSYSTPGTYKVTLISTTNQGCIDSLTKNIYVRPLPVAAFSTPDTSECPNGNNFVFLNNSKGAYLYFWNFGDTDTSTNYSPSHSYYQTGVYPVKLITTSIYNCEDSMTMNVYVTPHHINPSFNINVSEQCKGYKFIFSNNTPGDTDKYTYIWKFGDNTSDTNISPSHIFNKDGNYLVTLITNYNYSCKDSFSKPILVYPQPQVAFSINDSSQCLKNNSFIFTNNSTIKYGTMNFIWYFGDGDSSISNSPAHIYKVANNYPVKLIDSSSNGCSNQMVKYIFILPQPIVNLGIDTTIYDNQYLKLDAGGGFDSYLWSNNDTSRSIVVDSNLGKGKHLIWVKVTKDGCAGSDSINVTIKHFVSIDTKNNEFEVLVYPNPTNDVLNVEINGFSKDVFLNLTDLYGRQLKSLKVIGGLNHILQTIDISELGKGIYILNILGNDEEKVIKVIKY